LIGSDPVSFKMKTSLTELFFTSLTPRVKITVESSDWSNFD